MVGLSSGDCQRDVNNGSEAGVVDLFFNPFLISVPVRPDPCCQRQAGLGAVAMQHQRECGSAAEVSTCQRAGL